MGWDDLVSVGQWFVLISGICGFIIGFFLIFAKGVVEKLSAVANKAVSLDKIVKFFDNVPVSLDNWIMVKTKAAGILFILLSVFLIINGLPVILPK